MLFNQNQTPCGFHFLNQFVGRLLLNQVGKVGQGRSSPLWDFPFLPFSHPIGHVSYARNHSRNFAQPTQIGILMKADVNLKQGYTRISSSSFLPYKVMEIGRKNRQHLVAATEGKGFHTRLLGLLLAQRRPEWIVVLIRPRGIMVPANFWGVAHQTRQHFDRHGPARVVTREGPLGKGMAAGIHTTIFRQFEFFLQFTQLQRFHALPRVVRNSVRPEPFGAASMSCRVIVSISSQSMILRSLPVRFAVL